MRWSCQDHEDAIAHLTRKLEVVERRLDTIRARMNGWEERQERTLTVIHTVKAAERKPKRKK